MAFQSIATNLVPNDTNGIQDVFVHDLQSGITRRVSISNRGAQGNQESGGPAMSGNGEYVAFHSSASNLVAGDLNYETDCFVHHLRTGTTELISTDPILGPGDGTSVWPSISFDGNRIAFESDATAWDNGTNNVRDIFYYSREYGHIRRASQTSTGTQANSDSADVMISADGDYCVFQSGATNLVEFDNNTNYDVFLKGIRTYDHNTTLVSRSTGGVFGNSGSSYPSISALGKEIAFNSASTNLVPGDNNGNVDVFVHDLGVRSPEMSRAGTCPGDVDLAIARATPAGVVALLQGVAGSYVKPGGPCAGVNVGMSNPAIWAIIPMNGVGSGSIRFYALPGLCGRTFQALDLTTCLPGNPLVL